MENQEKQSDLAVQLEALYVRFNKRCYVHPDPLEYLYDYPDIKDREVVAFIAAALAYGNVRQILNSVQKVLGTMGKSPRLYLTENRYVDFQHDLDGFVHRFATGRHLASMLSGLKGVVEVYGTIRDGFVAGFEKNHTNYLEALGRLVDAIRSNSRGGDPGHLIASPEKGSACKRLHLFLRWMVRKDEVDPGGWEGVSADKLVVPLDTHMFRVCRHLGLTCRNQANLKTALEITESFARIKPDDPVRYDFVLTRQGIRRDDSMAIDAAC